MSLASRFSLLASVIFVMFFSNVHAQAITGYYLRPIEEPKEAFGGTAYAELSEALKASTGGQPILDQHFKNAIRSSLKKTYFMSFGQTTIGASVKDKILESGLFDLVVETTDEMFVGEIPDLKPRKSTSMDADPPECGSPIETNDPETFVDDYFRNMQIPCAWSITQGSPEITVAVVDWYFDVNHSEISGKLLNDPGRPPKVDINGQYTRRVDAQGESTVNDRNFGRHGTAMLAGVAAEWGNGSCVAGTGGETTLRAYSGLNDGFSILKAIQRACDDGNPIISLSAWQRSLFELDDPGNRALVRDLFSDVVDRGTTILFSVFGPNSRHLTDIPGVVLVGFGHEDGAYQVYDTDRGDGEFEMVVPASGSHRITGPNSCPSAANSGGSSLGTAFLSGIAALMLDQNQCLTPVEIEHILYETSDDVSNRQCCFPNRFEPGKGRVNAYRAVQMAGADLTPPDLIVNAGETVTIQDESKIYNLIDVHSGGTLNIFNSQVYVDGNRFGQYNDGRITVQRGAKLIARNSLLSSSRNKDCQFEGWSGIRVHGNIDREQPDMFNANGELEVNTPIGIDDAGVVMLLDETIIQNATNAVATTVPGHSWQDQVDRWGGLVIADRAIFRNNFRAAEFLRYPRQFSGNTFKNKSVFNECLFIATDEDDDRSLGITAWDTDGITVTKSTFKNLGRESIATIDGSFIIENGNTFINETGDRNHRHIMSMATYPYSGSMVVGSKNESVPRNEFYSSNSVDIFVSSTASAGQGGIQVINNDFYGRRGGNNQDRAIEIDGPSSYLIQGNFIEGSNPIEIRNTGLNQFTRGNQINCNVINNARYSMRFLGDNTGSGFEENLFTGAGVSNSTIYVDGVIDFFQGNASRPANNRFETFEQSSHVDIAVSPSSPAFNYYFTDTGDPADDVFEPRGISTYNKVPTSDPGDSNCSSGRSPGFGIKEQDVLAAQSNYDNIRNYSNPKLPSDRWNIENAKTIRDNLLDDFVDLAIKESNLSKINSLLPQIPGPEAKMRHFGACVELGDHAGANSLLSAISTMGIEYTDFVDVQYINLDRLQTTTEDYNLSEADSIKLDNIASSESGFRGYARALLYLLKGKRYFDSFELKSAVVLEEGEDVAFVKVESPSLSVFPNPVVDGQLKLTGEILDGDGVAVLRRMDGSVVPVTAFSSVKQLTINAPEINGIYFVQVTKGRETSAVKVIVK